MFCLRVSIFQNYVDLFYKDGDDEMTDYHNEVCEGAVWGIPEINSWREQTLLSDMRLRSAVNGNICGSMAFKKRGSCML